jgi:hypothetical protein
MSELKTLKLDEVRIDGGTQPRVTIDEAVVSEYADLYDGGVKLPPVVVFHDGTVYWLADGFHRFHATARLQWDTIQAEVHKGTLRDAVLYSVGANTTHGLRRTNADKRKAVETLLQDDEWAKWTDREISRRCGVHHQMVGKLRTSLDDSSSETQPRTYTTKHGTVAVMNTSNIGKSRPKLQPEMTIAEYEAQSNVRQERQTPRKSPGRFGDYQRFIDIATEVAALVEEARGLRIPAPNIAEACFISDKLAASIQSLKKSIGE